jgi:hypothetical protein
MSGYVHKHRAPVRVCLPGQDPIDGLFSLNPQSPHHDGCETILELLNSAARVIPFIVAEQSTVLLLTRLNIDWAVAGAGVDPALVCPRTYAVTREETVQLTFNDGRTISGLLQMELPQGMNRASDFLNGAEEFFPMRTRIGIVIVNKARVRDVQVMQVSPRPVVLEEHTP